MRLNAICSYMFVYVQLHKLKHNRTYPISWNKLAWYSVNIWNKLAPCNLIFWHRNMKILCFPEIDSWRDNNLRVSRAFTLRARTRPRHARRSVISQRRTELCRYCGNHRLTLDTEYDLRVSSRQMWRKCEDRFCGSRRPPDMRLCDCAAPGSTPVAGYARVSTGDGGQTPSPRNKPGCLSAAPWWHHVPPIGVLFMSVG